MKNFIFFVFSAFVLVPLVSAHVTVKPAEVGVGVRQAFSVGVPVEKDIPTTSLRLVIPDGLESVTPHVKPGWKIATVKEGEKIKEISWTGGVIPSGQRDEFLFTAKAPTTTQSLTWRAYQTYQNGVVVSWDMDPNEKSVSDDESEDKGPYSVTRVIDDLQAVTSEPVVSSQSKDSILPVLAVVMSGLALGLQLFSKKTA